MTTKTRLYDGETFEHRGYSFRVTLPIDDGHEAPWDDGDGNGIVSDWRRGREKAPGERVLHSDRGSYRFYDFAETLKMAKRDGWGCGDASHNHSTKGETAVCAVERDFERMRRWCENQWFYIGVVVTLVDVDEDGDETDDTEHSESLWGISSEDEDYIVEVARDLAEEILSRVEVDAPDVVLSEN